jgi:hypothetical protein
MHYHQCALLLTERAQARRLRALTAMSQARQKQQQKQHDASSSAKKKKKCPLQSDSQHDHQPSVAETSLLESSLPSVSRSDSLTADQRRSIAHDPRFEVVWMVAADTQKARERAMNQFNSTSVKVMFYEDFKISDNVQGVQSAYIDLLLLVQADGRVLTPGSSYSEFAWTMAGIASDSVFVRSSSAAGPRLCYANAIEIHPHCMRPHSLEPSFEEFSQTMQTSSCHRQAKKELRDTLF